MKLKRDKRAVNAVISGEGSMTDQKKVKTKRRQGVRLVWLVGPLIALGLSGVLWRVHQEVDMGQSLARQLPDIQRQYHEHHWSLLMTHLAHMSPELKPLNETITWLPLGILPVPMRTRLMRDRTVLNALTRISTAAAVIRRAENLGGTGPLAFTQSPVSWRVVVAGAEVVQALDALPHFRPGSRFAVLNAVKAKMQKWDGLARLITGPSRGGLAVLGTKTYRYLVLFQDSGELRATGGFMAAYGLLTIRDGRVHFHLGTDMSRLSSGVRLHLAAPWVLRTYFHQTHVSFINANLNPNVPSSARLIEHLYDSIPGHAPIDGMIFADSWLAAHLLGAVGGIFVDGRRFTTTSFYEQSEYLAEDRGLPNDKRLRFLEKLFEGIFIRVRRSSADLSASVQVLAQALDQKHVIVYANNVKMENWLKHNDWAGAIPRLANTNSLMVVNDNYGGLKDNYFMTSQVGIALKKLPSGRYLETVTTRWTMSGIRNGWMIGTYVGWVTCYVPPKTHLMRLRGYHVHGIRMNRTANRMVFGTGILIAARHDVADPPNIRTLTWVFLLPPLKNPRRIDVLIQPGLPGQWLTYRGTAGPVTSLQLQDELVTVK